MGKQRFWFYSKVFGNNKAPLFLFETSLLPLNAHGSILHTPYSYGRDIGGGLFPLKITESIECCLPDEKVDIEMKLIQNWATWLQTKQSLSQPVKSLPVVSSLD